MTYLPKHVFPLLTVIFAVSVVGELGRLWWIFNLFSHWRMLYILSGLILVLIGVVSKRFKYVAVVIAILCLHIWRVLPYIFVNPPPEIIVQKNTDSQAIEPQPVKIAFINTFWKIENVDGIAAAIEEMNPDFVFLEEIQPDQFEILKRKLPQYQNNYHQAEPMTSDIGFLSKLPVTNVQTIYFLKDIPTVEATVIFNQGPIKIIGVHPPSPERARYSKQRNDLLEKLFALVQSEPLPIVMGGDFNISQFSPVFRDIVKDTALVDTMNLSGLENSWPQNLPPILRIPIDQIFISPAFSFINRTVGPKTGSDHLPVMVEVAL